MTIFGDIKILEVGNLKSSAQVLLTIKKFYDVSLWKKLYSSEIDSDISYKLSVRIIYYSGLLQFRCQTYYFIKKYNKDAIRYSLISTSL